MFRNRRRLGCLALFLPAGLCFAAGHAVAQEESSTSRIIPRSGLVLQRVEDPDAANSRGRGRRFSFSDPLSNLIVKQGLADYHPQAGDEIKSSSGTTYRWTEVELGENGNYGERGRRGGGYLYVPIEMPEQKVMVLETGGQGSAYFNGVPRSGNVYGRPYVHLPAKLNAGTNGILLSPGRGELRLQVYEPPAEAFINPTDPTVADLIVGQSTDAWCSMVIVNASEEWQSDLKLVADGELLSETETSVKTIPPLSICKVGFRIAGPPPSEAGETQLELTLHDANSPLHTASTKLRIRGPHDPHKRTFVSEIDNSVQYFGIRTAVPFSPDDPPPAIVLSCHGAAVQAANQSRVYSTKSWTHLVAPTNRRPFGFDWEDFGRLDAMEVLRIAKETLPHDPSRIYLTGHSMGGHGAWHLGVTYPDAFAAIGPSAGWISRSTYGRSRGGSRETVSPIESIMARGSNMGDTEALAANLKHHGVYILHGAEDDNVPVSQARRMAEVLGEFHHDWDIHEEPGKRHWWNNDYGDGSNASVDWPFMFDMFARHAIPPRYAVRHVEFVTANPGVTNRCYWLGIEGQQRHLEVSRADVHTWPNKQQFTGTTDNVAVLRLDVRHLRSHDPITIDLDGQKLEGVPYPADAGALWLAHGDDGWSLTEQPTAAHKGAHRYGPIKCELKHNLLFVYGTQGDSEENAWNFDKARFDAETFWYRGNASVDVVRDVDFSANDYADRTVVLYGNKTTNAAWQQLLADSPVQVERGRLSVGPRELSGDDLSSVFLRPRADSDVASVVVVSATGPVGQRITNSITFFTPFTQYPDCLVRRLAEEGSESRSASRDVVAGYFGLDWSVENGEFAWGEDGGSDW